MIKRFSVIFLITLLGVLAAGVSYADRGMMSVSADPDIVLSEGAQRAVIAFNGTEEIMILATEASASTSGKVLEFLPLPSVPTIEEASPEVFERAMYLISRHAPTIGDGRGKRNGEGSHGQPPGIEVVSETTIGPHDITVVKIENTDHFVEWVTGFFEREGIDAGRNRAREIEDVVVTYLKRGIPYFVFDAVSVSTETTGIAPLSYRFQTDYLYYPLEISSILSGTTEIDLFLVTPGKPKRTALPKGFTIPDYVFPETPFGTSRGAPSVPISIPIDMVDRATLSPPLAALLSGWNTETYLTVVQYRGSLGDLSGDFTLTKADFSNPDFIAVSRAIENRKSLLEYAPPETVDGALITPEGAPAPTASAEGAYVSYLTGGILYSSRRVELPASYSAPAAVDGDPSTPFVLEQGNSWSVDLGRIEEIETVDILAAVPIPDKDTTFTYGLKLSTSDTGEFAGEQKMVGSGIIESYTRTDETDDVARRASLIRLTDKPVRTRYLRIEYIPYGVYNDIYLFEVMPWVKDDHE